MLSQRYTLLPFLFFFFLILFGNCVQYVIFSPYAIQIVYIYTHTHKTKKEEIKQKKRERGEIDSLIV